MIYRVLFSLLIAKAAGFASHPGHHTHEPEPCEVAEDYEQLMALFTNYALSCKEGVRAGAKPASEGNVEGEMQDGALSSFSYCFQADGVTPATIGVGGSVTYAIKDICPKTCGVCATVPTVDEPKVSEWAATVGIQEIGGVAPHVCPYLKALGYCETRQHAVWMCPETCGAPLDACGHHEYVRAQMDCVKNAASYGQTIEQCEQEIHIWTKKADGTCAAFDEGWTDSLSNCWLPRTEKECPPPKPLTCEEKGGFSHDTSMLGLLTNGAMTCKDVKAGATPASEGNVEGEMQDGAASSFTYCFHADGVTPATVGVGAGTFNIPDLCPGACGTCSYPPTEDMPADVVKSLMSGRACIGELGVDEVSEHFMMLNTTTGVIAGVGASMATACWKGYNAKLTWLCPDSCKKKAPGDFAPYNECDFMSDRVAMGDCVSEYKNWKIPGYTSESCIADAPLYLQQPDGSDCDAVTDGLGATSDDCYKSTEFLGSSAVCEPTAIFTGNFPHPGKFTQFYEELPGYGFCRLADGQKSSQTVNECVDSTDPATVLEHCKAKCDELNCGCFAASPNDSGHSKNFDTQSAPSTLNPSGYNFCPMGKCSLALDSGTYTSASWGETNYQLRGYKAFNNLAN